MVSASLPHTTPPSRTCTLLSTSHFPHATTHTYIAHSHLELFEGQVEGVDDDEGHGVGWVVHRACVEKGEEMSRDNQVCVCVRVPHTRRETSTVWSLSTHLDTSTVWSPSTHLCVPRLHMRVLLPLFTRNSLFRENQTYPHRLAPLFPPLQAHILHTHTNTHARTRMCTHTLESNGLGSGCSVEGVGNCERGAASNDDSDDHMDGIWGDYG